MNYYTAVSPFWLVAVSVCRCSGLLIAVSPFWFFTVLTIDYIHDRRSSASTWKWEGSQGCHAVRVHTHLLEWKNLREPSM